MMVSWMSGCDLKLIERKSSRLPIDIEKEIVLVGHFVLPSWRLIGNIWKYLPPSYPHGGKAKWWLMWNVIKDICHGNFLLYVGDYAIHIISTVRSRRFSQVLSGVIEHRLHRGVPNCTSLVPCTIRYYTKVEDRCDVKGAQGTRVCALKMSLMLDSSQDHLWKDSDDETNI